MRKRVFSARLHKKDWQPYPCRWAPQISLTLLIVVMTLASSYTVAHSDTQLTLSSSLTAGVGYGDNVKMSSNKALGDTFSTEQIALYLEGLQKRRTFSLTYEGLDQQYSSYSNLDRLFEDHYVGLKDCESLSRRTYLQIDDGFLTGNAQAGVVVSAGQLPMNSELVYSELFPARSAQNRFDAHLASEPDEETAYSLSVHQYVFSGGGSVTADQGISAGVYRRIAGLLSGGVGYQYKYVSGLSGALSDSPDSSYHWPQAQMRYGGEGPILVEGGAGPIVEQSTAGVIGDSKRDPQSRIDLGYQLSATYSNKALEIEASGGQSPGQTAGLAVGSLNRGGYVVVNYRGWRDLGAFSQVGYLDFLDGGTDARYLECEAGISYRLRRDLSVTAQYIFLKSSSSPSGGTSHSSQDRNYFFVSVAYALPAFRWSF